MHAPKLFAALAACATGDHDAKALSAAAHALKSLSRNVGAVRVGDLCAVIEDNAGDGTAVLSSRIADIAIALRDTFDALGIGGAKVEVAVSQPSAHHLGNASTITEAA